MQYRISIEFTISIQAVGIRGSLNSRSPLVPKRDLPNCGILKARDASACQGYVRFLGDVPGEQQTILANLGNPRLGLHGGSRLSVAQLERFGEHVSKLKDL